MNLSELHSKFGTQAKCVVDRDKNAAANILDWGILKHSGVERSGELLELSAVAGAVKEEKFITNN